MGRFVFADVNNGLSIPFPTLEGVGAKGPVRSTAIITESGRPLLLWKHDLARDAEIRWSGSPIDQAIYVFEGTAVVDGITIEAGGAFLVEHGGKAVLRAETDTLTVLQLQRPENHPEVPTRRGGHVHVIPVAIPEGEDPRTGMMYQLFADSKCPTCELWLHRTDFPEGHQGVRHLHTTDEIIVVVRGEMLVGNHVNPVGTALAIDKNTVYVFSAGKGGLGFINFRATFSDRIGVSRGGKTPPMDESEFLRSLPPARTGGWSAIVRPPPDVQADDESGPHYLDAQ